MFIKQDAATMIQKAKVQLTIRHPFFSMIVMHMQIIDCTEEGLDLRMHTMATDGKNLYYYPDFVEKLTIPELVGVIAHEVMHCAWLHNLRRGERNPMLWNIACDYAINPVVIGAGMTLPKGALIDPKYKDWSAPAIYEDLLKNTPKIKIKFGGKKDKDEDGGKDDGDGEMWGGVIDLTGEDGKPLSESERREVEEEIKLQVSAAAEIAKQRGNLPGSLAGLIEAVNKPKINWKEYIQSWVKGHIPDNYTWRKPRKAFLANYGIYMPSTEFNGSGVGVLSIDTSGSVSDNELKMYINEIVGVIEMCKPDKLIIVQHDADIQRIDVWESGDSFDKLQIKGRGGTCIMPSFNYVNGLDKRHPLEDEVNWMICFTDMEIGDWPRDAPGGIPVLWCATGPNNAPFGTYLDLREAM